MQTQRKQRSVARANKKDVRRPEDWFPQVARATATSGSGGSSLEIDGGDATGAGAPSLTIDGGEA